MGRTRQTALTVFLFVVIVECVIAFFVRAPRAFAFVEGDIAWSNVLALAGLMWLPVVLMTVSRMASRLRADAPSAQDAQLAEIAQERAAGIRHRTKTVLDDETLEIALQPIIGVVNGAWLGAEALSRFPDNRPPDVWFGEAHEVGLGVDLELLAMRRALEVVHALPVSVALSVNASPGLILDRRFSEALADPTIPLHRIVVEITEHAVVDRYDDLMAALRPLRDRGLRVSVDDTGAGYASLRHVLRIRPDNIKLDRSFVAEVVSDGATRAMVTAIVLAAMEMGASVTAEGVEDHASMAAIEMLGVDSAQGYLLARPTTEPWDWAAWGTKDWRAVLDGRDQAKAQG